jgi:glycosyltransferase involved in cell wall biosynthesis
MIIHLYACCYNEQDLLPYFLRYYQDIADKIIVYDNHSTDESINILKAHPKVTFRYYDSNNELNDFTMLDIYNQSYKESRGVADWVICVDIDEIIVSPKSDLRNALSEMFLNGVMIPRVRGFQMVNETFIKADKQIWELFKTGVRDPLYDKASIFRPEIEINYLPGRHLAEPICEKYLLSSFDELALLHYKFFGRQRFINRSLMIADRNSEINRKNNFGNTCKSASELSTFFDYSLNFATEILG